MRRSLLFSCALHALIVVIALAMAPRRSAREAAPAVEVQFDATTAAIPAVAVATNVDVRAQGGGSGPARPTEPAVAAPVRAHRARAVAVRPTAADRPPAPESPPGLAAPPVTEDGAVEDGAVEVAQGAPASAPESSGATSDRAANAGDGAGAGDGLGDGIGDGFGPGAGGGAMSREMHARVLGNEVLDVRPRPGTPTISHDEATALRTHDRFPRLPESVWPEWRPYIVKLELCVGEDGHVSEAALRSSASARLDPVVLAAAKTWRYRPRLVDDKPAPFCHGVVIKYERW